MLLSFALLVLSVGILYFGAELSLDASEKIGKKMGLSPLIIGMVLIGFGTSLPEFFVAHIAGVQGRFGIALGGLIGSNIANMFLILGICGFLTTLSVASKGMLKHLFIHLTLAAILWFVLTRADLSFSNSIPLILLCGIYLFLLLGDIRSGGSSHKQIEKSHPVLLAIKLISGFGMLYLGGEFLVKSGSDICIALGMSEYLVSAIFIAFGTSFPELVTALLACFKKKETDLIIGNIVGSNLFNCAFILGSLGIYKFPISIEFTYELILLSIGSAYLFLMGYFKKTFHFKSAIFFIAGYLFMVLKWTSII